jgi:hypothetical protein
MSRLHHAVLLGAAFCVSGATPARGGAYLSMEGQFVDNGQPIVVPVFAVPDFSDMTLRTWSWLGGTNAAGRSIAAGGIDAFLKLKDSVGVVAQNDDIAAFNWDSRIEVPFLPAAYYSVELTASSGGAGDGHYALDVVNNTRSIDLVATFDFSPIGTLACGASGSSVALLSNSVPLSDMNLLINPGGQLERGAFVVHATTTLAGGSVHASPLIRRPAACFSGPQVR